MTLVSPLQSAIYSARAKRNAAAGVIRKALMDAERELDRSPDYRARHELDCLRTALASLVKPVSEPGRNDRRVPLELELGFEK